MNASDYRIRRATLDDMAELGSLLQATSLPAPQLEKRFIEFQVAEAPNGQLVAALGFQMAGSQAKIHSESYTDFGLTDLLRPIFWERMQTLAQTQHVTRLWTQETAPFWKQHGFEPVAPDLRMKMPAAFGDTRADWLTLKLRDEINTILAGENALDKEFTMFIQSEKARSSAMAEQAKLLKGVAFAIAILLFLLVIAGGVYLFMRQHQTGFIPMSPPR